MRLYRQFSNLAARSANAMQLMRDVERGMCALAVRRNTVCCLGCCYVERA